MRLASWFSLIWLIASGAAASELDRPMVWCHYVAWHDWNKASASYQGYYDVPLVHPTGDVRQDYRQEIDEALRAGIDGFIVDLLEADAFSDQMVSLLDAAKGTDFKIAGCLDGFSIKPEPFTSNMVRLLKRVEGSPNLARVDGKPLFTTFWSWRTTPEHWRSFRALLKQKGFEVFLAADPNTEPCEPATREKLSRYAGCFDMLYSFAEYNRLGAQQLPDTYRVIAESAGKFTSSGKWMGCIVPGYLGAWPFHGRNDYYVPFKGIDHLWDCWQHATANRPTWIHLTTWNDLDETPLQPMLFSFHTYPEVNRWWIDHWKGIDRPSPSPRVYAVYPREQMLGTVQRIEVVSLPTTAKEITVSGELRGIDGKTLYTLPPLHIAGDKPMRCDWAVPTLEFASSPVVEPVIEVAADNAKTVRRLPFFALRTGWIANHVVVRAPVHEMAEGKAVLSVSKSAAEVVAATVHVESPESVRYIVLYRNDRPVGTFMSNAPDKPIYSLVFEAKGDCDINATVADGSFVDAYLTMNGGGQNRLKWNAATLSATFGKHHYFAAKVSGGANTTLAVSTRGQTQSVSLAELLRAPVDLCGAKGAAVGRLRLSEVDAVAANPPPLDAHQRGFTGQWHVDAILPEDVFYARCETAGGRVFFSNVTIPFDTGLPKVNTTILQTAVSLDNRPSHFLTATPIDQLRPVQTAVHPAMVQRIKWSFDQRDGSRDTAGRNHLHLGSAEQNYAVAPSRLPKREKRQDAPGWCLALDGVDDVAEIPIRQMPCGSFTIDLDIFPEQIGPAQTILGCVGSQGCPVIRLAADGKLQAGRTVGPPGDSILATNAAPLPLGKWSRIRVTFDETTVRLFVDGRLAAQTSGKPARAYGNAREYLGGPQSPFKGKLANVQIVSVAEGE